MVVGLQFEWQSWLTMEHININSSGSVYHILHWVGCSLTNPPGLLNLVWRVRPSQAQPAHNGYYSINLFLSEQPNTRWWRPETAVATCHMSLCHYVRYINNGHHQDGLAWRPVQSQGVLTSLSLILLYGYVMYIFDFEIILCRAHLLTDKNIL